MIRVSTGSLFVYWLFIPLLFLYHVAETYGLLPFMKQVFYFAPLLGGVLIVASSFFDTQKTPLALNANLLQTLALYLLVCLVCLVFNENELYTKNLARDMLITSLPLLFFAFPVQFKPGHVAALLIAAIVCYLIWVKFDVQPVFLSSLLWSNYYFSIEYHFGTIACLFFLYYFYQFFKKTPPIELVRGGIVFKKLNVTHLVLFVLSLMLLLMVNKRASALGIICALVGYYGIVRPFQLEKHKKLLFMFLLFYYLVFYIVAMNIPWFSELFLHLLGKENISVDAFLTGRMVLLDTITPEVYNRGAWHYFLGNGPGQSDYFVWKTICSHIYNFYTEPFLVHNDFLKLHFDIGLVGVGIYFFVLYYLYATSRIGIILFMGIVPLFLIDNTIIFMYNIVVAAIMARSEDN